MAEQQFREIQLSGKQLVFLFMTTLVLAVAIFLLGVSVGRGARPADGSMVEQTAEVAPPADLPPPTELTTGDLSYHETLTGQETPPAEPEPEPEPTAGVALEELDPVQEPVGQAPPSDQAAPPARTPAPEPAPSRAAAPAQTARTEPPAAVPEPPPADDGWALQVGAYSSRANADRQMEQLRARGFNAFVTSGGPGNLHRVRVGPFADRAEADRVAAQLVREEGLKSSVIR